MSAENVQIVRLLFDWWGTPQLRRAAGLYHEDVVMEFAYDMPGQSARQQGYGAIRDFFRDWLGNWEVTHVEVDLVGEGDRVLATWSQVMSARASHVTIDQEHAAIFELRDGRIARVCFYLSPAEGRAAFAS